MRSSRRTRALRIAASLPLLAALPLTAAAIHPEAIKTKACTLPAPIAHRGGIERYTENTEAAFLDTAANIGVRFWETDAQITKDGVWIIMHDTDVDRTTDGTGAVADLTYAQIAALRTPDGQAVPTLQDFIDDQSIMKAYAFIELKSAPANDDQWRSFVATVKSREGAGGPRPAISSFDPAVLDQVATWLPGYTRALIQSVGDADPATITPHASILLKYHNSITTGRLQKWTSAGVRVYAWADIASDPASEWARMAAFSTDATPGSVSGYITGTPGAYLGSC